MQLNVLISFLSVFVISFPAFCSNCGPVGPIDPGWEVGIQCWSFHKYSFCEAVEKAAKTGADYIEIFPGQPWGEDQPGLKVHHSMTPPQQQMLLDKAAEYGLEIYAYGVVGLPNDEKQCREVFEFAKALGLKAIASEPPEEAIDLVDNLCQEYQVAVAIHNHPDPSHYWNPDTVLKVCRGKSRWLGACADTGHWTRSGVNPIEAVKKLKDRIIYFHLKDLNEFGRHKAHDVIWGTGKSGLKNVLMELKKQGYHGFFSVEYEHNWETSVPEIQQCIRWFRDTALDMGTSKWENLLDKKLSQWQYRPGTWLYQDGQLMRRGSGSIWSKNEYADFILELDYKLEPGANSGVFLRCSDLANWIHTTIEIQIHDSGDGNSRGTCGAVYDIKAPRIQAQKPAGQWNHFRIECIGPILDVYLNGKQVNSLNLNEWTEPGKNPDGSKNKFDYAYKNMKRTGRIGLQDHGDEIAFRNVRIMEIAENR